MESKFVFAARPSSLLKVNGPLPVTLVGGFPGSGKTSLLHHYLSEHATGPVGVFVESAAGSDLDARALRGLCGAANRASDVIEEIPPLEDSAQLDWLVRALTRLSRRGGFQHVLIEVSGTSNAARLGRGFGFASRHSEDFSPWAKLQNVFCVIDALDFYYGSVLTRRHAKPAPFLDLQRSQIESANVLILNKCDLVRDSVRASCLEFIRVLNPHALLIETAYGELSSEAWSRAGNAQELGLALEVRAQTDTPGASAESKLTDPELQSVSYRIHRPFHPGRFWDWFDADHPGLLRVKGIIWLATRNLLVGGISRTRWQSSCGGAGIWWAALPREEWPEQPEALQRMQAEWREPYGDRRQELSLLGSADVLPRVVDQLASCLLTEEEYARPVANWLSFPDPFPVWDVGADG